MWDNITTPNWRELYNNGLPGIRSVFGGQQAVENFWQSNVFTNNAGHFIFIGRENHPLMQMANSKEHRIMGHEADTVVFTFNRANDTDWGTGGGFLERLAGYLIPEGYSVQGQERRWGRVFTQHGITFNSFGDLLVKLETSTIPKNKKIILNVVGDSDIITGASILKAIGGMLLSIVETAAKGLAGLIGIPPEVVTLAFALLRKVIDNQPITLNEIAPVIASVVPADIRNFANKGLAVYGSIRTGNYQQAARELGVNIDGAAQFANSIVHGIENSVITNVKNFDEVRKTLHNIGVAKSIDTAIRGLRSGSFEASVIDKGVFNSKVVADLLVNATGVQNIASAMPGIERLTSVISRESIGEIGHAAHRELLNLTLGIPVVPNVLKNETLQGLLGQAVNFASNKLPFLLPAGVRPEWRTQFAQEIAAATGATVVISGATGNTTFSKVPCAFC